MQTGRLKLNGLAVDNYSSDCFSLQRPGAVVVISLHPQETSHPQAFLTSTPIRQGAYGRLPQTHRDK